MSNKNKTFFVSVISEKETYSVKTGLCECSPLTIYSEVYNKLRSFINSSDEILYITVRPIKSQKKSPDIAIM